MPLMKAVTPLYDICLKTVHLYIYSYCARVLYRSLKLAELNCFLTKTIPTNILDDLLLFHENSKNISTQDWITIDDPVSFYFYKATLHPNIQKFQAKNYRPCVSYWKCLFETSFANMKVLNLALSCNDAILKMISKYCPNLEWLNATCKYERMNLGINATSFSISVTDVGLAYLCDCKKLKVLTINDPRSAVPGLGSSITYQGIRKLLREVKTLEDITYTDIGAVIASNMEDVESLNLNVVRHFNGTKSTLSEIFRLCKNIQELYLMFFMYEAQCGVMDELLNSSYRLQALEIQNMNVGKSFVQLFEKVGASLVYLTIANFYEGLKFTQLVTIGKLCPNLKSFCCSNVDNRHEDFIQRPANMNQFKYLENLFIDGHALDLLNVTKFLTENARNLKNFKLEEKLNHANVDSLFEEISLPATIQHIELGRRLELSRAGVKKMIDRFTNLRYLNVYSDEDCNELVQPYRSGNYDFTFINKKDNPLY